MENVILAALLHDIGKFWQRSGRTGRHEVLSETFCRAFLPEEMQTAAGIAALHREPSKLFSLGYLPLKAVVFADWLSAGEREERSGKGDPKREPIVSIFSNISIEKGDPSQSQYHLPYPLGFDEGCIFPREALQKGEIENAYRRSWSEFEREVEAIKGLPSFESYYLSLYHLLKKYTWTVPSAVYRSIPDVSLFDHAKTTCAIAACLGKRSESDLNRVHEEILKKGETGAEDYFLLIGGDISGIQSFIYTLTSKGAAKSLRGRSFYLQLLTEAVANYILREMDLPIANLLYCGGGHFYIISPVKEQSKLAELKEFIERELLKMHKGELYLALGWVPLNVHDFEGKNFSKKWDSVVATTNEEKLKKFALQSESDYEKVFGPDPDENAGDSEICDVCKQEGDLWFKEGGAWTPWRGEEVEKKVCTGCRSFEDMGDKLGRMEYLLEVVGDEDEIGKHLLYSFRPFNVSYYAARRKELDGLLDRIEAERKTLYIINSTAFLDDEILSLAKANDLGLGFRFIGNVTPFEGGKIKDFDELAEASQGIKRIGILRMDVDDLGKIFSTGLGDNSTISRVSTLSSMLSLFFEGWINRICEDERYKNNIYIIYSGGDDLFIVGSWNFIPELAKQIYEDFRRFTCNNPNITISAGVSVEEMKYPLYKAAKNASDRLDKYAKEYNRGNKQKDAISFLYKQKPLDWREMDMAERIKDTLYVGIEEGRDGKTLPKSILNRLGAICVLYSEGKRSLAREREIPLEDLVRHVNYERWRWILTYNLHRSIKQNSKFVDDLKRIEDAIINNRWEDGTTSERSVIEYLDIPIRWADLLTREEMIR